MKFRDGYWEIREGVKNLNLIDIIDTKTTEETLTVYTATRPAPNRGARMAVPLLTTEFSSPLPDIIRVKMYRHKGGVPRYPEFALPPAKTGHIKITNDENACGFSSGKLGLTIPKQAPWRGSLSREGKELTEILGRLSGHFSCSSSSGNFGGASISDFGRAAAGLPAVYMAQYLKLSVGETIYGLGERFTPFVKNGQTVDMWNEDGGTVSEQAYKNIPFYISSNGYGVLVNNPGKVSFEIASEVVSAVQFSVLGEEIEYYLIAGDNLHEVLKNYASLTGKPALPPAWSFGLWLSTSFTTDYDEKTVNSFIDGMAERKLPLSVFHFDCFWMKECQWVDFEWDKKMFPDPRGILSRLKEKGLKICVWINPYIAQKSCLFDEGMEQGYLVRRPNGDVWQWDRWQAGMALVDFTNPAAAAWYQEKLKRLLDMGVDTFKTDFGERIPTDVTWYDGSDSQRMHNYYTYLYNKTVFDLLEAVNGKGEALVFARSAAVGSQRFPVHWGGDCSATYESMAETLRGGLSLSLCGFGFWSHDISGFEQTATPDLFKRWAAFGLLSSHSRLHGNQSYRVPWNFDEEACDVLRFFTELKCRLMPYLWQAAVSAHREGLPLMRAMILEFPDDPACAYLDRQYMLGGSLLAAPIFSENGSVSYYLPRGKWTNVISGALVEGGSWQTEQHGYCSLPLLARPNSIIALGGSRTRPDYDYADGIVFHVFELEDGGTAGFEVCDTQGNIEGRLEISRTKNRIEAACQDLKKPWSICLRNIHRSSSAEGARPTDSAEGLLLIPERGTEKIVVEQ